MPLDFLQLRLKSINNRYKAVITVNGLHIKY